MSDSDNLSGMGAGDMSVDWRDRAREWTLCRADTVSPLLPGPRTPPLLPPLGRSLHADAELCRSQRQRSLAGLGLAGV